MTDAQADILAIFTEAVGREDPAERSRFLDEACGSDTLARDRVETLLRAHFDAGNFLGGHSPPATATVGRPVAEKPGTQIGPYQLLEQIGEGGFGVVFMAEQLAPVRRRVAIKVIKPGMDTRQVIARFEAERQALAVMDHPNIARVFDAGATESGRPYFVMELVHGEPITEYCDTNNLAVRERLELFATICQAIQHAHTKGIIHRDIKPTNILVTQRDGQGVVKVIDFGVAKAIGQRLTDRTQCTEIAQMIGTPLYMSPEQAAMSNGDIDTRSDIYSLGVLLYELLTGSTPVNKEQLKQAFDEIRRIIREDEPPKPSSRIGTAKAAPSIAARRRTEPAKLARLVHGELDWIVMKALDKDRTRRYETASGFANDVERYLHDEPVLACPPSKWYWVRKLIWRNKGSFIAASAMLLLLLLTIVTLVFSNTWIRKEQARTQKEKDRAERAQGLAEVRAEEIRQGLEGLKLANAWLERGRWYAGRQRWDDANAAFTKAVELRPDHAAAWIERGDLLAQLGLWDLASDDFSRALAEREPEITHRWFRHALLRLYLGDREGYRAASRRLHERFRGTRATDFALEIVRTAILAPDASEDLATLRELARERDKEFPGSWHFQYLLGIAEYRLGEHEQAAVRLRQSLTGYPEGTNRALSYPILAMALHRLGDETEARLALANAADALERWTLERYGRPGGTDWLKHQGATAMWPLIWWDWLEFQVYYREAMLLIDGKEPRDDPRLLVLRARSFAGLRRNFTADKVYAAAIQLSPDDAQLQSEAHRSAGYSAVERKDWRQAASEFTQARQLAPDDPALRRFEALALLGAGEWDAYREACRLMLEQFEHATDVTIVGQIVGACILTPDALPNFDQLLPLARATAVSHHNGGEMLTAALYRAGRYEEAVQSFEAYAALYSPRAADWATVAMAQAQLGHASEARRCLGEAVRWIDAANQQTDDDLTGVKPAWGGWHEPMTYPLLLREAAQLIESKAAGPSRATPQRVQAEDR